MVVGVIVAITVSAPAAGTANPSAPPGTKPSWPTTGTFTTGLKSCAAGKIPYRLLAWLEFSKPEIRPAGLPPLAKMISIDLCRGHSQITISQVCLKNHSCPSRIDFCSILNLAGVESSGSG